ncbi:MAG: flavin reductase family protein [Firmicutes bacterium]|nr:flavin reductase family protein [Bacillota bacterium]
MKKSFNKGFLTPHPVFIIATYDENGKADAMNAAWGGQVGMNKLSISLSPHKTTQNIKTNKEFTVSFATKEQVDSCDYVGIVSGGKVSDKLEKCGFTVTKSDKVNAPIIDQLPVAIECRVLELQEEFNETRVVAEIVGMKADESVLTDGKVDLEKLHPIMFDSVALCYREIGGKVGGAWSAGKKFE